MFERLRYGRLAGLLSALLVGAIACSTSGEPGRDAAPTSPAAEATTAPTNATVTLSKNGCAYRGPAEMPVGEVSISMINTTNDRFDLDLWLLDGGHAYDELAAHITEEQRRAEAGEPGLGHPTFATLTGEATADAETTSVLANPVASGTYGLACIRLGSGSSAGIWSAGPFTVAER